MFHSYIVRTILLALFTIAIRADDQIPTFNLKNKSPNRKMALVVSVPSDKGAKRMRIRDSKGDIVFDGLHEPSRAIIVLPKYDLSYYDLHNAETLDMFYVANELRVDHIALSGANNKTTYYVKWCRWISDNFSSDPCSMVFGPQEGVREKLFSEKSKTTDGYSLEYNVTYKNIAWGYGKAGTVENLRKYTSGKWNTISVGTIQLPTISFDGAEQGYKQLVGLRKK